MYDTVENPLLDRIYAAALDVSRWPSVMEAVAHAVGARNGRMTRLDNTTALGETIPFRIDHTVLQAYAEYDYTRNVFIPVEEWSGVPPCSPPPTISPSRSTDAASTSTTSCAGRTRATPRTSAST